MSDRPDLATLFNSLDLDAKRRTLVVAADALCLCARGNGVDDTRIKGLVLAMRSPDIGVLFDDEAAVIIDHLDIRGA